EFKGYQELTLEARVLGLRRGGEDVRQATEDDAVEVFLDATPLYAESGGQVGDTGEIAGPHGRLRVEDTQRPAEGVIAHVGTVVVGTIEVGEEVTASVDTARRHRVARHHSATHLLHKALRETLGEQAIQKGSWVGPDHTTFDFAFNRAVTREELEAVSRRVSEQVRAALPFHETYRSYQEAVESGAMHLFEEKYGDTVRVVCFGDWTCELCGGTHVANSADVGTTAILSESSVAAGVRRLDLVAGEAADELVRRRLQQANELARALGVPADQLPQRVADLRTELKEKEKAIARLNEQVMAARLRGPKAPQAAENGARLVDDELEPSADLKAWADMALGGMAQPGVAFASSGQRYVLKVHSQLTDRVNALEAREHIGPGGGRPEFVEGKLTHPRADVIRYLKERLK
ncbi:MAG: alanine--tRNA ligase-related protein, partial [Chloroflexota bacterium]